MPLLQNCHVKKSFKHNLNLLKESNILFQKKKKRRAKREERERRERRREREKKKESKKIRVYLVRVIERG